MLPYSPAVDAKLTIAPAPRSIIAGSTDWQATNVVTRFAVSIAVSSSSEISANGFGCQSPAQVTRPSTGPSSPCTGRGTRQAAWGRRRRSPPRGRQPRRRRAAARPRQAFAGQIGERDVRARVAQRGGEVAADTAGGAREDDRLAVEQPHGRPNCDRVSANCSARIATPARRRRARAASSIGSCAARIRRRCVAGSWRASRRLPIVITAWSTGASASHARQEEAAAAELDQSPVEGDVELDQALRRRSLLAERLECRPHRRRCRPSARAAAAHGRRLELVAAPQAGRPCRRGRSGR